ncbi:MAG TPA: hypothetical protein VN962_03535 [Polyangia bacterium]|nr:hypothetical protein [Polyangia bacterium]
MKARHVLVLLIALVSASCSLDASQKNACVTSADCLGGQMCVDRRCQPEGVGTMNAGSDRPEASVDASPGHPDAFSDHSDGSRDRAAAPPVHPDASTDRRDGSVDRPDALPGPLDASGGRRDGSADGRDGSADRRDGPADHRDGAGERQDGGVDLGSTGDADASSSPHGNGGDDSGTTPFPRGINGLYQIDVCFRLKQEGRSPPPNWTQDQATVMSTLADTWQANSAVIFQSHGDCPTPTNWSWVSVEMQYDSDAVQKYGGAAVAGIGSRLDPTTCADCQVVMGYSPDYFMYRAIAVHVFGRVLGFGEEAGRSDFPGCLDIESGNWDPGNPGSASGPLMTADWDIESIMGEWQCWVTRQHDSRDYDQLSAGDIAEANMVYPLSLNRTAQSLGSPAGFHTATGLVVRSDGWVETDWTESGASGDMFSTTPSWFTVQSGVRTSVGSGMQIAAPVLAAHAFDTIYASYVDYYERSNTVQDAVTISSPMHAALIGSMGPPL